MNRHRILIVVAAGLCAALWTYACGDGPTEPPTPPPDPPRPATVAVAPAAVQFTALGATEQLTAEVRDQNGNAMAGAAVSWASSAAAVATVSASGLVTAADNGTATITATAGSASGSATVTAAQEVSAVAVTPAADTLIAGDTLRLAAEAADANGHPVAGAEFDWASSDTLVAVVDDAGLVTGIGAGEAEVMATAAGVTGRATLSVVAPAPTAVAVIPDTVALTALGQTAQLAAEVRDQNGRVMEGVPVSWSSADTTVAVVDSAGLVTGIGGGATTIAATAGAVSGTAAVTVMRSVGSVVVSPAADTVAPGDTLRLAAEAFDANGHLIEGAEFAWSSGDGSIATVDATGMVRGLREGRVTITAASGDAQGTAEVTVENPDRAALVALYEAAGGRGWANRDNWLTDAPLAEWHGIETDRVGRVVSLDLGENGLAGRIPVEIGDLAALERFVLTDNQLTGPIPSGIGGLSNLTQLLLAGNSLEGAIPSEVGKLAKLESLELARNQMTGQIPAELGDLSNLERLWLGSNFMKGPLPPELGNLAGLRDLRLSNMGLTGPIPPELGNLSRLWRLDLFQNALTGPVPTELGSLSLLWRVELTGNQLTGALPASMTRLTGLGYLNYGRNAGLCAPGSAGFVEWTRGLEGLDGPFCNRADREGLEALFGAAGGDGWTNSEGWLGDRAVGAWHGVAADSLGRVTGIELADNGLAGELPAAIGDHLARMTVLKLDGNDLSGRLPMSLARVPLREFRYAETELCAPPAAAFRAWLDGIASHEGTGVECPELSDREILAALYEAADGPNWTGSENWLTDAPLEDWHGVHADNEGRVTELVLRENGLSGRIPPELGELQHLTRLDLADNGLEGPIPPELGALSGLEELALIENGLTGPIPRELGNLSALRSLVIANNSLGGSIPSELARLSNLEYLWLGNNLLTGRIPPELANLSSLVSMWLGENLLIGRIPPELGNLTNLRSLRLGDRFRLRDWDRKGADIASGGGKSQTLSGPIPPELGSLTRLRELQLAGHSLTGVIPPELGRLAELEAFHADDNFLTGPIPAVLGGLTRLEHLSLTRNQLTGPVPPELGNLARLVRLSLNYNALSGVLPSELGGLAALEQMELSFNRLEGPLPATFGGLAGLEALRLSDNPGMSGALPHSLTALEELEDLTAGGTGLCAPSDTGFGEWLNAIPNRWIALCGHAMADAYLVQAVQSREFPVPLVAGDDALVRVFPTAAVETHAGIPPVRVHFYVDGRETHVEDIAGKPGPLPTEVDEGSLETSANAVIPGSVVQPGLEMVVEIDPDGTLDPALGVARRIPETGRMALEVAAMPFELTLVPFLRSDDPDSLVLDLTARMATDPQNDPALWNMKTLLPVNDGFEVALHEPVWTSDNSDWGPLRETQALQVLEGATGHYVGMLSYRGRSTGRWETRTSMISVVDRYRMGNDEDEKRLGGLIAHEMGHAMTLRHTPGCKPGQADSSLDPSYPYPTGIIGAWGWDPRLGGSLVRPGHWEVMSTCDWQFGWISAYNFTRMVRHRLRYDMPAPRSQALLVWGGVDEAGVPFLEPAFVVAVPTVLPDSTGPYTLSGAARDGRELFSLDFPIYAMPDSEGNGSFVFALPARPGWEGGLASITLSGPGGSFTLDGETDQPMAILRDPSTGQVRGFLRNGPAITAADGRATAARMLAEPGLERLFSRGIPDPAAWRR